MGVKNPGREVPSASSIRRDLNAAIPGVDLP